MNFQQLRFAVAVADTGSLTRAADLCCVTQPALSNAISQLEEELGCQLFKRTTRSVTLSDFGERLIADMRGIGDSRELLYRHAAEFLSQNENSVRIGVSPLVSDEFVSSMLSRIKAVCGDLSVVLSETNKGDIGPGLESGLIDYGLLPSPSPSEAFVSQQIYSEPLLYLSADCERESARSVRIDELPDQKLLLVGDGCGLNLAVRNLFMENQLTFQEYEGRALSYHVLEKWTQLGIGSALLPASKVQSLDVARRLNDRDDQLISLAFEMVWLPSQEQRPHFAALMQALDPIIQSG